jgi:NAD(P)H dehydrogenase (quinone)
MTRLVVAFHSGYGHTRRLAESVQAGAAEVPGVSALLLDVTQAGDAQWAELASADAIVFGAPTYMGGASGPFKTFADASAKVWFSQGWKIMKISPVFFMQASTILVLVLLLTDEIAPIACASE